MIDSTNPRVMADNIRQLAAGGIGAGVEANPEGVATDELEKLGIGGDIYSIPKGADYSTNEVDTGIKWIDGKAIYRKVIDVGNLPNSTTKTVASGIENIGNIVKLYGVASAANGHTISLPYVDDGYVSANIMINYEANGNIRLISGSDKSNLSGYVIIEYTKSS